MGPSTKMHYGVDIAAPHGTPVRAAADGVVRATGKYWPRGRYVEITHKNGYTTNYYHLYKDAVRDGQKVERGDIIGYEGDTGNSTGPHLHFEIRKYGVAKDPALYLSDLKK
jgi:murein DD-endopeptidase MepM/ murein hydrolase activator NlpD